MRKPGTAIGRRGRPLLALALLGAGGWLLLRGAGDAPPRALDPEVATEIAAEIAETPPAREPPPPVEPRIALAAPPSRTEQPAPIADDGLPFMPPRADDPRPEGPVHPHPITPAHQRIFRENRLIGALDGAMDAGDVPALRRLLAEYRAQYPEDANMLQGGYQVIADCMESPGAASQAAARRFSEERRGSTLRRFVNRHCF